MSTLIKLDDLSLSLILARLSIQDMWTSGRVCVRLSGARRNCANVRRELALVVGMGAKRFEEESVLNAPERRLRVDEDGDMMIREFDQNVQLQIYSFPLDFVRLLLTHFTNLTTLTICIHLYSKEIDSIMHLLEQFNLSDGTLHTLNLYSGHETPREDEDTERNQNPDLSIRLLTVVNSIGSLRKLAFDVNAKFFRNLIPQIDLPILAQLEEFAFNSADEEFFCLYDSIMRYAVNNQALKQIDIQFQIDRFTWLLTMPIELSSRFTHLHLCLNDDNKHLFVDLCRHLSHLTSLEITYRQLDFTIFTLFQPLAHLTNLLSLLVNIKAFAMEMSSVPPNERGIMHFQLPSVKVFTINITNCITNHHNFLHHCNMNRLFPNVQIVRVIREEAFCGDCVRKINRNADRIALEEHCARHMFRHFVHCRHLRMVSSKVVDNRLDGIRYRQWAWNEMEQFEGEEI